MLSAENVFQMINCWAENKFCAPRRRGCLKCQAVQELGTDWQIPGEVLNIGQLSFRQVTWANGALKQHGQGYVSEASQNSERKVWARNPAKFLNTSVHFNLKVKEVQHCGVVFHMRTNRGSELSSGWFKVKQLVKIRSALGVWLTFKVHVSSHFSQQPTSIKDQTSKWQ